MEVYQHTSQIISCSLTKPVATLLSVLCLHAPSAQVTSLHKTIELVIINYFTNLILDCKIFSLGWCNFPYQVTILLSSHIYRVVNLQKPATRPYNKIM